MSAGIFSLILACVSMLTLSSCIEENGLESQNQDYGYIQFKLYKQASYVDTKAIDYLNEIAKVKVTLDYEGQQIAQTLVLDAADAQTAEYGLRSEKLRLLAGTYTLKVYELFNKLDSSIVKISSFLDSLSTLCNAIVGFL